MVSRTLVAVIVAAFALCAAGFEFPETALRGAVSEIGAAKDGAGGAKIARAADAAKAKIARAADAAKAKIKGVDEFPKDVYHGYDTADKINGVAGAFSAAYTPSHPSYMPQMVANPMTSPTGANPSGDTPSDVESSSAPPPSYTPQIAANPMASPTVANPSGDTPSDMESSSAPPPTYTPQIAANPMASPTDKPEW